MGKMGEAQKRDGNGRSTSRQCYQSHPIISVYKYVL